MTILTRTTAILALLLPGLLPAATSAQAQTAVQESVPLVVSCYRGPWEEVIWDRPNASFLKSLRNMGYDRGTADKIATSICRDPGLVSNTEGLRAAMLSIWQQSPAYLAGAAPAVSRQVPGTPYQYATQ